MAQVYAVSSSFPDVPATSEHAAAIEYLKSKGIISGYKDGTFKPEQTINRAEALKLVFLGRQALSMPAAGTLKSFSFPDVKSSDWFYQYVAEAYSLGIVQGYEDGSFKPANEITAAESLKVLFSGLVNNFQLPELTSAPFTDVLITQWYAPYVLYGKNRQLIEARGDGSYHPERKITRAEFAELIYRVIYSQSGSLEKFPISQNWLYCNEAALGYKIKHPYSWLTMGAGKQLIFWKQDQENGQVSFARVFPNSAVAIVAVDDNESGLSLETYVKQIEYGSGASRQMLTLNGLPYSSILVEQNGLQDSYFQMPDGKILIIYAQFGSGALTSQLKEELRYIIGSVKASTSADPNESDCLAGTAPAANSQVTTATTVSGPDQIKAEILKEVLIAGKATVMLEKVSDEVLFETDSIGIGTGPVDYYFSQSLNLTLKIDRNSDTILATESGKTSSF
jgi:hypothetical protein